MGWFNNLFSKKIEKQKVNIKDLDSWFNNKISSIFNEVNDLIKNRFNEIDNAISILKESILALENADIEDPEKIENKVKQIVLGNRINYIRILNDFLDNTDIPKEINYKSALNFCSRTEGKLDDFSKNTAKTYYTVQHLFGKEVEEVIKKIRDISNLLKKLKQDIEKKNIVRIEKAKTDIQNLKNAISKKALMKKELEKKKNKLNKTKKIMEDLKNKLDELKKSQNFLELNKNKKRLDEINYKIRNIQNEIIELLSPLKTGFKKFKRVTIENENLVEEYSENPVKALLEDKEFKIIEFLQNMKKRILDGKIELKEKKKKKILERIDEISKEKLSNKTLLYDDFKKEKEIVERQIKTNKTSLTINDINNRLECNQQKLNQLYEEIRNLESTKKGIDLDKLKIELEEDLKFITNIEVNIIM